MLPYLLIVLGPTGSGKGSLPSKVITKYKLEKKNELILVDNYVEKNPYFKLKIDQFIKKQTKQGKNHKQIINMFMKPTNKMINTFNEIYFDSRKERHCKTGKKMTQKQKETSSCDIINDKKLTNAFSKGKNIVFETKGTYWPSWLFDMFKHDIIQKKYNIIMAWSIVDICELLFRNKNRAKINVEQFLQDSSNPPPRLPDIKIKNYTTELNTIIKTFLKNNPKNKNKLCVFKENPKTCIRLLLFDNNTQNSQLLYDSMNQSYKIGNKTIKKYNVKKSSRCTKKTS